MISVAFVFPNSKINLDILTIDVCLFRKLHFSVNFENAYYSKNNHDSTSSNVNHLTNKTLPPPQYLKVWRKTIPYPFGFMVRTAGSDIKSSIRWSEVNGSSYLAGTAAATPTGVIYPLAVSCAGARFVALLKYQQTRDETRHGTT